MKLAFRCMVALIVALLVVGGVAAQYDEVIVQFNWIHDSPWAEFYVAADEGYYADNGINVDIRTVFDEEGNFIDVIDEVVSGRAQFGVVDSGVLLSARADDIPVKAIATIYQRNPLALVSLAEKNIVSPLDLVGKTAHISDNSKVMFEALLRIMDIDPAEVNIVTRTDYSPNPILSGEADVLDAWVSNEVAILSVAGVEFNAIYPFEYGVDMYANVIITSEALIQDNPELVQRFLEATLKGIQGAVDNPEKAAEATVAWGDNLDLAEQAEGFRRSIPLLIPSGSQPGIMLPEMWELSYDILVEAGVMEEGLDLEAAYTTEFLDDIYSQ